MPTPIEILQLNNNYLNRIEQQLDTIEGEVREMEDSLRTLMEEKASLARTREALAKTITRKSSHKFSRAERKSTIYYY